MAARIAALREMSVADLREKYHDVFGEETRSRHKDVLWKRIESRVQALEEGDLSERARRRAAELANDVDVRVRAPRGAFDAGLPCHARTERHGFGHPADPRLPMPGTVLTREHKGRVDRLALQRFMTDVAAGRVNVVLVYKLDRLSRSLLDFTKVMEVFTRSTSARRRTVSRAIFVTARTRSSRCTVTRARSASRSAIDEARSESARGLRTNVHRLRAGRKPSFEFRVVGSSKLRCAYLNVATEVNQAPPRPTRAALLASYSESVQSHEFPDASSMP